MKRTCIRHLLLLLAASPAAFAQLWEVGGAVGASLYTKQSVVNGASSADATFRKSIGASAWVGHNAGLFVGGELRYDYEMAGPQLSSSGAAASFTGHTQAIHYDVLFHFAPRHSRFRPFVAAGFGAKSFAGTGLEQAFQPLSNLALLTRTSQIEAMGSFGAGLKYSLTDHVQIRADVHDYLTGFPQKIVTPVQGSRIDGLLQDIVPAFGIAIVF